ncbi:hypothetical protein SKAU_G00052090 [Synaphobranchus kaupii]|uniref:Uncharacterized protein n=1 Tax=Synaphobranchus kaupii TaxID=118154 RepID=A0A9Q1G381_SYNKA|nr:hypothetical protein SKAU_G00052090 [Synaphobranchus kaupii]
MAKLGAAGRATLQALERKPMAHVSVLIPVHAVGWEGEVRVGCGHGSRDAMHVAMLGRKPTHTGAALRRRDVTRHVADTQPGCPRPTRIPLFILK